MLSGGEGGAGVEMIGLRGFVGSVWVVDGEGFGCLDWYCAGYPLCADAGLPLGKRGTYEGGCLCPVAERPTIRRCSISAMVPAKSESWNAPFLIALPQAHDGSGVGLGRDRPSWGRCHFETDGCKAGGVEGHGAGERREWRASPRPGCRDAEPGSHRTIPCLHHAIVASPALFRARPRPDGQPLAKTGIELSWTACLDPVDPRGRHPRGSTLEWTLKRLAPLWNVDTPSFVRPGRTCRSANVGRHGPLTPFDGSC